MMEQNNTSKNHNESSFSPKKLILMCGYPGTGKTTLARYINKSIDGPCAIIHRDSLRNLLHGKGLYYSNYSFNGDEIDKEFLERAEKQLNKNDIIILDATFRAQIKRQMVYEFARKNLCEVIVIHCDCSMETAYRRLERQIFYEESKPYINSLNDIFDYSQKVFDEPTNAFELTVATIIKIDTEREQLEILTPKEKLSSFAIQLIQLLEHFPFFQTTDEQYLQEAIGYSLAE